MAAEFQGKTEFDVFNNFYSRNGLLVQIIISNLQADCKNDIKSDRFRQSAVKEYQLQKYYNCLENYTMSLCYATYNGRQYALALANRSAVYFCMKLYENCIIDINLSLKADYPNNKKPKLYFRKLKCLGEMGKRQEMLHAFEECCTYMTNSPDISKTEEDRILKEMKAFMEYVKDAEQGIPLREISFTLDERITQPHPENRCASSALTIKRINEKNTDMEISAARNIKRGEVLFIEKAFVGFHHQLPNEDSFGVFYCDFCSHETKNCVPCKTCIHVVYCSEICRHTAWYNFHQWECKIFSTNFLNNGYYLPLRTVIRAASDGSINAIINKPPANIGTPNLFLKVYKYAVNFHVLRQDHGDALLKACLNAVYMVEVLKSSNFFDFLMTTPHYTDTKVHDLFLLIGGILLKTVIQTFQRSLIVNRLSPRIIPLNDNQYVFKLSRMKMTTAAVFCPTISGLPHSCLSNTSISFHKDICTVKAFKNIKAGDVIYRCAFRLTPNCSSQDRKSLLQGLGLKCKCEACKDSKNVYEHFDTFVCHNCGGRATLIDIFTFSQKCADCNIYSEVPGHTQIRLMDLFKCSWFEGDCTTLTLPATLTALTTVKGLVQPYHSVINKLLARLVVIYSKTADVKGFLEALTKSKSCFKTIFIVEPINYICSLGNIFDSCFQFLYNNKGKLQKQEAQKMIIYFTNIMQEAKEVISVEIPSLVNMFIPAEFYLSQFKTDYLQLESK